MSGKQWEHPVQRIVSGGQTGVDRAALEAALDRGLEHGGWCPRGRLAEDGVVPHRYRLRETESSDYWVRTEKNVLDSEGTLILYREQMSGGTELTYRMTRKHHKPCLAVDLQQQGSPLPAVRQWIQQHQIRVLNVAGPRESSAPGIFQQARQLLQRLFGEPVSASKQ